MSQLGLMLGTAFLFEKITKPAQTGRKPPTRGDKAVREARARAMRAAQAAGGQSSTILTGGGGLAREPLTGRQTLLGTQP